MRRCRRADWSQAGYHGDPDAAAAATAAAALGPTSCLSSSWRSAADKPASPTARSESAPPRRWGGPTPRTSNPVTSLSFSRPPEVDTTSMFGSRDSGDGLRRSTSTVIDGGGGDLLDLTGAWRLRMLVMEKSVDDALHADFVGSAGFSDGCISTEDGIASVATVAGGDCDAERSSSTDDGDIGELINFLFVVVVAGSSIESQQTVDCILNYRAVVHFSADEMTYKLQKISKAFSLRVLSRIKVIQSTVLCTTGYLMAISLLRRALSGERERRCFVASAGATQPSIGALVAVRQRAVSRLHWSHVAFR